MAAGLLALRDAAIPLTPVEQIGKGGLRLIRNWQVPQHTRDRTGIVFASCFPGFQMALMHAKTNGDDGEGRFDRRYLFQTLQWVIHNSHNTLESVVQTPPSTSHVHRPQLRLALLKTG